MPNNHKISVSRHTGRCVATGMAAFFCARVQEEKARGKYPRPAPKVPPRGYRERNRAEIPVTGRKSTAARVQEEKARGNTRGRPKKYRRAGYFVEAVSCKAVTMFITEGIISGVSSNISVI